MKPVILTGGIASGKSTVLNKWREMGVEVASADEIAKSVFLTESVQQAIKNKTGVQDITREMIRTLVAEDVDFRNFLNKLTHPLIFREIEQCTSQAIEIPLAIEACLWNYSRAVVVTWCPIEVTTKRLFERGLSTEEAQGLISSQVSPNMRLCFADHVIRTNDEMSAVLESAREIGNALF